MPLQTEYNKDTINESILPLGITLEAAAALEALSR